MGNTKGIGLGVAVYIWNSCCCAGPITLDPLGY